MKQLPVVGHQEGVVSALGEVHLAMVVTIAMSLGTPMEVQVSPVQPVDLQVPEVTPGPL